MLQALPERPLCSIVIPAKNEAENLSLTISELSRVLAENQVPHEILIVNDVGPNGDLKTKRVVEKLSTSYPAVRLLENPPQNHGLGKAIAVGLDEFKGACVAIVMADGCDDPKDVVTYYRGILEGYDCVFGSRFMAGGEVLGYPKFKLFVNRVANWFLAALFFVRYQDFTNAFKMYSRVAVSGIKPVLSPHFAITVELPIKAIIRGYTWKVVPNRWYGKKSGVSNLRLSKMASRYLYIASVLFLERILVRTDYFRKTPVKELTWRAS